MSSTLDSLCIGMPLAIENAMAPLTKNKCPHFIFPRHIHCFFGLLLAPIYFYLGHRIYQHLPGIYHNPTDLLLAFAHASLAYVTLKSTARFSGKQTWALGFQNTQHLRHNLAASLRNLFFTVIESRDALYLPQRGAIFRITKLGPMYRIHTDGAIGPVVWKQIATEMRRISAFHQKRLIFFSHNEILRS